MIASGVNMKHQALSVVVILVLIAAVFGPVATHQFIVLDDPKYIYENPAVQQGFTLASVAWSFTTFHASNWHPLTWLSHLLDIDLFGLDPRGHHLMNVFYHTAAAVALLLVLVRYTAALWPSLWVAAGFAIHPLRVESVAWAAERKDVLAALLWMLTLAVYLRYVHRPGKGRWLTVLGVFILGLMGKPMLVTLPLVLLLLDVWPLGRIRDWPSLGRLMAEKVPLLGLSAVSAILTLKAQAAAVVPMYVIPISERLANAAVSTVSYLGKTLWPSSLAIPYPGVPGGPGLFVAGAALLFLLLVTAAATRWARQWPFLITGWGWYLVTLLPVLGLVQVGEQAMADRYTYIPSVGLAIAAVWLLSGCSGYAPRLRAVLVLAGAFVVLVWSVAAAAYVREWKDGVTLFEHTLRVTRNNWLAQKGLAIELKRRNRIGESLEHLRQWVAILPDNAEGHYNLAHACHLVGDLPCATHHYRQTLALQPDHSEAHNNLGVILAGSGNMGQAIEHFRAALLMKPNDEGARSNLMRALAADGGGR